MNVPEKPELNIVYEHGAVVVLNKPCGLLTQSPPGIDSLELRLKSFVKVRDEKPGKVYLVPVHRLDRPVSGAIVFAKNVRAAKRLSEQFRNRTVSKTYWAIVEGEVEADQGRWVDFMRKIPDEAKSEIVPESDPDSKKAILNFRVLARNDADQSGPTQTLLEIDLETGRTHQIRLQCATHGVPIVGDALYGSKVEFGTQTIDLRQRQIGLHARRICFEHPIDHEEVAVVASLPENWNATPFANQFDSL